MSEQPWAPGLRAMHEVAQARREAFVDDVKTLRGRGMTVEAVAGHLGIKVGSVAANLRRAGEREMAKPFERAALRARRESGWRRA